MNKTTVYLASRGVSSLAWLLEFTKSFAWLVSRVVGLLTPRYDFVNAKSHTREKPLLAWYQCLVESCTKSFLFFVYTYCIVSDEIWITRMNVFIGSLHQQGCNTIVSCTSSTPIKHALTRTYKREIFLVHNNCTVILDPNSRGPRERSIYSSQ